jgi:hypothetical protein
MSGKALEVKVELETLNLSLYSTFILIISIFQSKSKHSRHHPKSHDLDIEFEHPLFEDVDESMTQCYGPGCSEIARPGSKYCSDDCGMKLATK